MAGAAVIVLDIGKTLAKLSLWQGGRPLARHVRPNARIDAGTYAALDTDGIERWLMAMLREMVGLADIGHIITVGHGAAAAIVRDGALACAPIDYEDAMPAPLAAAYDLERDSFENSGSPRLPDGLNLGAQLFRLEHLFPDLFALGTTILPWPQYWSWRLSGVAASEVTSLGCHSDLWRPASGTPSALAIRHGWDRLLAPIQAAGAVLGPILPRWAETTGLPRDVQVHCGLHDSNAALLAARGFPEISENESTIVSTGTWFVAMRSPATTTTPDLRALPEHRDCLVNVDASGRPVPSARFMGGREIELLTGLDTRRIDIKPDQPMLIEAAPRVLASGAMILPSFAPGFGPYPDGRGRWIDMPGDPVDRRAAVSLYAALMADTALDLIGARDRILIEGRFAEAEVLVRALAALRPRDAIYVSNVHNDVAYGALRLLDPELPPASALTRVEPLCHDLDSYRSRWRRDAERTKEIAA